MNRLVLTAQIAEISAQRQTPAGIPAIDLTLEHQSEQAQAGQMRKVKVSVRSIAIGAVADAIRNQPIGSEHKFSGFLGSARNAKGNLFHIQEFEII